MCVCTYIDRYIYRCMHIHINMLFTYIYSYIYIYICMYTHKYIYEHRYICIFYLYIYLHIYSYMYICGYVYINIHIFRLYIYTYAYISMLAVVSLLLPNSPAGSGCIISSGCAERPGGTAEELRLRQGMPHHAPNDQRSNRPCKQRKVPGRRFRHPFVLIDVSPSMPGVKSEIA